MFCCHVHGVAGHAESRHAADATAARQPGERADVLLVTHPQSARRTVIHLCFRHRFTSDSSGRRITRLESGLAIVPRLISLSAWTVLAVESAVFFIEPAVNPPQSGDATDGRQNSLYSRFSFISLFFWRSLQSRLGPPKISKESACRVLRG